MGARGGGGAGEGAVGGYSVSLSFITKPWALGGNLGCIRKPSWAGQTPVLSSSAPEPGVIWGSGSAPWLCSHSELTALHADGNSMGSSLDLAELAAGQPARADIIQQVLEGPPSPGGQRKRNQGWRMGGPGRRRTFMTHSCMMDDIPA